MPTIKTAIVNKGAEDGNAPKQLYFEITNQGTEDVYVLKRNTPLEGLKTDCLEVKVNGEPVLYDGYFFKRASPKPQEYQLLQAGETLSVSFDLSQAYDTSLPGTYSVQFDLSNLVVMPAGAERESFTPESLQPADVTLENDGDSFAINEAQPGPTTIGAATRSDDKKKVGTRAFTEAATLQQPVVKGGSSAQQKVVIAAHQNGYALTTKAISGVSKERKIYNQWFGAASSVRENIVMENYGKMKRRMETTVFTYNLTGSGCGESDFAYTVQGAATIWLCTEFWQAPAMGLNSQAGTIVHEHSHATAYTDDVRVNGEDMYGEEACKKLAASLPNKAIINADNYEYFSESLPSTMEAIPTTDLQHLTQSLNEGDDVAALEESDSFLEGITCNQNPRPWRNWRVAEALKTLLQQVNAFAPNRSRTHDGTIGDTAHQSRVSDHNPWVLDPHTRLGVVTALDITHDPANKCDCHQLTQILQRNKDKRIKYVIWNSRIMNSLPVNGTEAWQWRNYSGSNPHNKHMHVSVKCDATSFDVKEPWNLLAL